MIPSMMPLSKIPREFQLVFNNMSNGYLLNGRGVKRDDFLKRSKNFLVLLKNFAELKNVTLNTISIQHVTLFHIFCDC